MPPDLCVLFPQSLAVVNLLHSSPLPLFEMEIGIFLEKSETPLFIEDQLLVVLHPDMK